MTASLMQFGARKQHPAVLGLGCPHGHAALCWAAPLYGHRWAGLRWIPHAQHPES